MITLRQPLSRERHGALARGSTYGAAEGSASICIQILEDFRANGSLISVCWGTASIWPPRGLIHKVCEAPSRFT